MGAQARAFTRIAGRIVGDVPPPAATWSWSEVDISRSDLTTLKRLDLIVQVDAGEWSTTDRLVRETSNYARVDEEEVTAEWVVQSSLGKW